MASHEALSLASGTPQAAPEMLRNQSTSSSRSWRPRPITTKRESDSNVPAVSVHDLYSSSSKDESGNKYGLGSPRLHRLSTTSSGSGDEPGSPTRRRSVLSHMPDFPSLPTASLLSALPGAAHLNPGTLGNSPSPHRQTFRPTFAPGEDRTKLDPVRQRILDDTLALFGGRVTSEILQRHWRPDAVFEDPLSQCRGYREYSAHWFALAKLATRSTTLQHRVLASTSAPSRIVYMQTQEYILKFSKKKRVVQSMVVIHLDAHNKISKLEDKWQGDEQPDGWGSKFFRRLNAKTLPIFISVPKPHPVPPARPSLSGSWITGSSSEPGSETSYPPRPLDMSLDTSAATATSST